MIAFLATRFAIKRRLIDDDASRRSRSGLFDPLAVNHDRENAAGRRPGFVAQELGRADLLLELEPDALGRGLARAGPGAPRVLALAIHGGVEAGGVDLDAARFEHVLGEIDGKAIGVVELERDLARQPVALPEAGGGLVQEPQAPDERALEAALLELEGLGDERLGAVQLGVGLAHRAHELGHQSPHERLDRAENMGVAHGAAHDAPEHVAAALVRGHDAVGDQEAGRAQMVGDDPVRDAAVAVGIGAGGLGRGLDQGAQQVDGVVVVGALEDGGDALEPHAGVDRGPGQGHALIPGHLLELHEHQVPDLDEAVALGLGAARRAAGDVRPVVIEDFRARPARTGLAHGPEVVGGGDAQDAAVGKPGDLPPQIERLVVVGVDGDQQAVAGEAELARDQVPGQLDGQVLEVVAEREVAQHLEEGVMAGGVAHVLEIVVLAAGADALLGGGGAHIVALLGAGEDVLELDHARIREHQRRVVARHQRAGRHHPVVVAGEIVQVNRDRAFSRCHVNLYNRSVFDGYEFDLRSWSRFFDLLERREGVWRIAKRTAVYEKDRMDPVDPRGVPKEFFASMDLSAYPAATRFLCYSITRSGRTPSTGSVSVFSKEERMLKEEGKAWLEGA